MPAKFDEDVSTEEFLERLLQDVKDGRVQGLAVAVDYKFADIAHAGEIFVASEEGNQAVHANLRKSVEALSRKFSIQDHTNGRWSNDGT
jgi:microcystin degradation protein MlrC